MRNINDRYLEIKTLTKNQGHLCKKYILKTDYGSFPGILVFFRIFELFLHRKSHGSGLWITGPRLALGPWWTRNHVAARPLQDSGGRRDSLEREGRSSEFSPIMPLGGRAVEMVIL
jgi:hypothetical protein